MNYGITKEINQPFADAVAKVKAALSEGGFGILSEIDVQATLRKKLGVDFEQYIILGACNPPLAFQALQAEKEIGLLLPCNVIVYEESGTVFVSAIRPTVAMSMVENPGLTAVAQEVEAKLANVVTSL